MPYCIAFNALLEANEASIFWQKMPHCETIAQGGVAKAHYFVNLQVAHSQVTCAAKNKNSMKILPLLAVMAVSAMAVAQTPKADFKHNIRLSGGSLAAYPHPGKARELTPPPDTLHPFHISFYGCSGSHFLDSDDDYDAPLRTLARADSLGKLTLRGRDLLRRLKAMRAEAAGRAGELTETGERQLREIAERMQAEFGEVFEGDAYIDAGSVPTLRCVMSMQAALLQLARTSPALRITSAASRRMSLPAAYQPSDNGAQMAVEAFCKECVDTTAVAGLIFSDRPWARDNVDGRRLNDQLFRLASATQNSDMRYKVTLYDLFSDAEILANWRAGNARWYAGCGAFTLGGRTPWRQAELLRQAIARADSCAALATAGASLRFVEDSTLLSLLCLMDIDDYGFSTGDLSQVEKHGWLDYRAIPMAGNVQLVFYRRDANDRDPWVKIFLNENEARLPLKSHIAPYYRWADVRRMWLERIFAGTDSPEKQAKAGR